MFSFQIYITNKLNFRLKFIYSEKATKFREIFALLLTVCTVVKSEVMISSKFCGLLRIYELQNQNESFV